MEGSVYAVINVSVGCIPMGCMYSSSERGEGGGGFSDSCVGEKPPRALMNLFSHTIV